MDNEINKSIIEEQNPELFSGLCAEMNLEEGNIETINIEKTMKSLDSLNDQLYFVMNLLNYEYDYFSQKACDLLGLTSEQLQELGSKGFLHTFVHPDDIIHCFTMFEGFTNFLRRETHSIKNLRALFSYRIKTKTGEYKRVIETSNIVRTSEKKNTLINIGLVSFSSDIPKSIYTSGSVIDITTGNKLFVIPSPIKKNGSHNLTKRETQIVGLIATGLTTKEISEKLYLSKYTIETHRKNILKKLKVKNSVELVWKAIELSLTPD